MNLIEGKEAWRFAPAIIQGPRRSGTTTMLVKLCIERGLTLVQYDAMEITMTKQIILPQVKKMLMENEAWVAAHSGEPVLPEPMTFDQFISGRWRRMQKFIDNPPKGFVVDHVKSLLQQLAGEVPVPVFSAITEQ